MSRLYFDYFYYVHERQKCFLPTMSDLHENYSDLHASKNALSLSTSSKLISNNLSKSKQLDASTKSNFDRRSVQDMSNPMKSSMVATLGASNNNPQGRHCRLKHSHSGLIESEESMQWLTETAADLEQDESELILTNDKDFPEIFEIRDSPEIGAVLFT